MGDSGWEDGSQPLENIQIPTLIILLSHVYDDAQSAHGASYAEWHQCTKKSCYRYITSLGTVTS